MLAIRSGDRVGLVRTEPQGPRPTAAPHPARVAFSYRNAAAAMRGKIRAADGIDDTPASCGP
jgi:hypothetical protein